MELRNGVVTLICDVCPIQGRPFSRECTEGLCARRGGEVDASQIAPSLELPGFAVLPIMNVRPERILSANRKRLVLPPVSVLLSLFGVSFIVVSALYVLVVYLI